ncbi:hypothetical protein GCM10023193_63330 [Planotetraspora kaengkrachanensis]|uniref:Uncharacterized protein n=2 Tax=Planotetraspora kaengkrachanensis TaxID=575193 RepID=A0A8J3PY84_9ACTN|nr:hypothetical protein Pka01_62180 [Planotetraspora kaengkrachanensis]
MAIPRRESQSCGPDSTLLRMSNPLDVKQWGHRYVAQWNEPDPETRRALIRELWAPDGIQVLVEPPETIRDAASALAFPVPPLEVRGHDALDARVTRAYEMFVAPGEHVFEAAGEPVLLLSNVLALRWSMVSARTGEAVGGGLDVLALDGDGRIGTDHQFIGVN